MIIQTKDHQLTNVRRVVVVINNKEYEITENNELLSIRAISDMSSFVIVRPLAANTIVIDQE